MGFCSFSQLLLKPVQNLALCEPPLVEQLGLRYREEKPSGFRAGPAGLQPHWVGDRDIPPHLHPHLKVHMQ